MAGKHRKIDSNPINNYELISVGMVLISIFLGFILLLEWVLT